MYRRIPSFPLVLLFLANPRLSVSTPMPEVYVRDYQSLRICLDFSVERILPHLSRWLSKTIGLGCHSCFDLLQRALVEVYQTDLEESQRIHLSLHCRFAGTEETPEEVNRYLRHFESL